MDDPLVSIVVPAYNEAATIEEVLRRAERRALPQRGHRRRRRLDRRHGATSSPRVDGVQRSSAAPRNAGKGAAVRDGIAASQRATIVVIQDADLEYDPKDLPKLRRAAHRGPRRRRLRHAPARRRAPARAPVLALRGQPLPLAGDQRRSSTRRSATWRSATRPSAATSSAALRLVSDDFRFEPEVTAKVLQGPRRSACTRSRSPTTGARSPRARRSRGATGSRRVGALVRFRVSD